jgi:hypothetical protein
MDCFLSSSVAVPTFPVRVDQRQIAGRGSLLVAISELGRDGAPATSLGSALGFVPGIAGGWGRAVPNRYNPH